MRTSQPVDLVPPLPHAIDATDTARRDRLLLLAIAVAATVVSLIRIPLDALDVVWAEDGARFLVDAIDPASSGDVLLPYDGYLHVVPRILAELIETIAPIGWYAAAVRLSCALVTGLVAAGVFWYSRGVTPWVPARLAISATTVLLPIAGVEVLGNLANLHWYALWLAPWLLLHRPRSRGGATAAGAVALLVSLTELQLAVFLPLALWRLRDRRRWPLVGGLLLGVAAQLVATIGHPRPPRAGTPPDVVDVVHDYLLTVPLGLVTGSRGGVVLLVDLLGWAPPLGVLVLVLAAGALVFVRGTTPERLLALAALAGSVVLWTAGYVVNVRDPDPSVDPAPWQDTFRLLRYGVVPALLLATVIVLASAVLRRTAVTTRGGRVGLGPTAAVLVSGGLVGILAVGSALPVSVRSTGPSWSTQIREADEACDAPSAPTTADIALSPSGWSVPLSCAVIEGG